VAPVSRWKGPENSLRSRAVAVVTPLDLDPLQRRQATYGPPTDVNVRLLEQPQVF
jgi:hypothetical protein